METQAESRMYENDLARDKVMLECRHDASEREYRLMSVSSENSRMNQEQPKRCVGMR